MIYMMVDITLIFWNKSNLLHFIMYEFAQGSEIDPNQETKATDYKKIQYIFVNIVSSIYIITKYNKIDISK